MAEASEQAAVEGEPRLPTINEELAKIFPDSAEKFLKKKRGRPPKDPSMQKEKLPGRGRGRPRMHPVKPKVPGRGRGRPKLSTINKEPKQPGKVGRPRSNITKVKLPGKVGRPPKNGNLLHTGAYKSDVEQLLEEQLSESDRLRKKVRMSYVDDYVELDEDENSDVDLDNAIESPSESDSGFLSNDNTDSGPRKRGRPKKILGQLLKKKPGPSHYETLKIHLLKQRARKGPGRPKKLLQPQDIKRGRGRPRKDENKNMTLVVRLERLSDLELLSGATKNQKRPKSLLRKVLKKRGRPKKSETKMSGLMKKRGRPKKAENEDDDSLKKRGRPRKIAVVKQRGRPRKMSSNLNMKMRDVSVSLERLNEDYLNQEFPSPERSSSFSPPPKKRGRPPKQISPEKPVPVSTGTPSSQNSQESSPEKKKRGRPPKQMNEHSQTGRKRGRPKGSGTPKEEKKASGKGRGRPKKIKLEDQNGDHMRENESNVPSADNKSSSQNGSKPTELTSTGETNKNTILKVKAESGEDMNFIVEVNESRSNSPYDLDQETKNTALVVDHGCRGRKQTEKDLCTDKVLAGTSGLPVKSSCGGIVENGSDKGRSGGLFDIETVNPKLGNLFDDEAEKFSSTSLFVNRNEKSAAPSVYEMNGTKIHSVQDLNTTVKTASDSDIIQKQNQPLCNSHNTGDNDTQSVQDLHQNVKASGDSG